jgi:ligand-binding SRPBCC domain-containing protein
LRRAQITESSRLAAPADVVWARVVTPAGVNDEMRPLMRMTVPRGLGGDFAIDSVEPGVKIGRSWVLAFGLIPFDYDDLTLERIDPGHGFLERSKMLSQRLWEHERTIEPVGDGCTITDRIAWEPRLPLPGALFRPLIAFFFRHRHSRLRRRFGGERAAAPGE